MQITVYSKPECHLCEEVLALLDRIAPEYDLSVREVNILDDPELEKAYHDRIPVIVAGDGKYGWLFAPIDEAELRGYLGMVERGGAPPRRVVVYQETKLDRVLDYISHHWLRFICIALGIFVGLPWLAPVFAALGWWDLANPIYTAYALTCHQLPERAGFIFGYQVAFCYRNTAIYAGVLIFGILFAVARDRNVSWLRWLRRPLHWYWFVLLLVPMFLDGVTHMFGLRDMLSMDMDTSFGSFYIGSQAFSLNWWLRIITGGLAALGVAWFAFPRMARVVAESEAVQIAYRQSVAASRRMPAAPSQ
ncbi:MAG TPA: DUF2085 domain-containing protein [Chloroflexia bacterium]|nr:DUF2085 domain-containing protein [Chloroflexia bacterium]